jgi:hypothetical protein
MTAAASADRETLTPKKCQHLLTGDDRQFRHEQGDQYSARQ